ncbi:MAG: helix-turn-helix domain-containing protein [Bacteroidetes bacterium]|jgi:transcriptional regulator with XRE-family HTH domain|nr:helix-turn-helix domain-containing protein [Bacteroidota bacterium]
MDTLGSRVKKLQENLGLSQAELAKAAHMTQATISRLLSSKLRQLKSDRLKSLADALNVTADFLLGENETQRVEDIISRDSQARDLVSIYSEMNSEKRRQLLDFVKFLTAK